MSLSQDLNTTFQRYPSRRSVVHSTNGIVACSQPLAAQAGIKILREGGNAADAAVAVAACLNVTEPTSTGIGGDAFCLFYDAKTRRIHGLNASGRSPAALTLEKAREDLGLQGLKHVDRIPASHVHSVTVPGAAAGWCDTVERFGSGKFNMSQILSEAIRLAEEGHPVTQFTAFFWQQGEKKLRDSSPNYAEMLRNGERAPKEGEIVTLKNLAKTFRVLAEKGKKGFYEGAIAESIVQVLKDRGGVMTLEDLKSHGEHGSEETEPIGFEYEAAGLKVWEHAPNGQGLIALIALGVIESLQKRDVIPELGKADGYTHNSTEYLHAIIESLKIAFSDGHWWIADPSAEKVPTAGLLDKTYLEERSKIFDPAKTTNKIPHGSPAFQSSDTVYFSVVDKDGNGCSFINSNFRGFGSGIIPPKCGFTLQNRGSGFNLTHSHPNSLAPSKRPYHTIIPALITDVATGALHTVFGVMGGFMQPQGHLQVFLNMCVWGMSPQEALDAPRVSVGSGYDPRDPVVHVEEGIGEEVVDGLKEKGHIIVLAKGIEREMFGKGQIIRVRYDEEDGGRRVYSAGSDLRGDGHAVGY